MNEPMALSARAGRMRDALRDSPPLAWSFLYFFCLLSGYYVLRPVRDAMGASADAEAVFPPGLVAWAQAHGLTLQDFTLQVLFTGTFICMLLLQPAYGWLVARFPRRVFLPAVYLLFVACLVGFYFAFHRELPGRGAVFFIWVAVFNLFAVSVFWSFMADVFATEQSRQVYGYIGAGGTLGGLAGPVLTKLLVLHGGVANLMLVSVAFLLVCLLCIVRLGQWARRAEQARGQRFGEEAMGGSVLEGLRLIARDPLLRALSMLMVFGVGVGTLLYNQQREIALQLGGDAFRTAFYSNLDLWINVITLVVQLVLTRSLLTRFGVGNTILIPCFAVVAGYALLAASPVPLLVAIVQVATRAGEFSLGKPARETIYTQVDRHARYKAKAAIDTVIYRGSDVAFAWVHKGLSVFGSHAVFGVGIGVALMFTFSAWLVRREHARLADEGTGPDPP
ncbi:MAG: NTP/NDP exchange transporter [Arenimonas sp.]